MSVFLPKLKTRTKKLSIVLLIVLTNQFVPSRAHAVDAGVAGLLSIVPGLGQAVNGEPLEGLGWFGAVVIAGAFKPYLAFDIWMYNMYDAYRDAKPKSGKFKNHNFFQNYIAPFNPLNIIDPVGAPLLIFYSDVATNPAVRRNLYPYKLVSTAFIGWSEEALFRGFLFPALSDTVGSAVFGAITSSFLFAVTHTQYGSRGKILVGAFGLVECLQIHLNSYDLRKNIFVHSWVDFFLLPPHIGPLEREPSKENLAAGGVKDAQSILANGVGFKVTLPF